MKRRSFLKQVGLVGAIPLVDVDLNDDVDDWDGYDSYTPSVDNSTSSIRIDGVEYDTVDASLDYTRDTTEETQFGSGECPPESYQDVLFTVMLSLDVGIIDCIIASPGKKMYNIEWFTEVLNRKFAMKGCIISMITDIYDPLTEIKFAITKCYITTHPDADPLTILG